MRIKLDENLPAFLAEGLAGFGHDVDTGPAEGLKGRDDGDIWAAAQKSGRFLITQDLDFSDVRRFLPGSHHGILLVRLKNPGRQAIAERALQIFQGEEPEGWSRCFVVASERKIRVRRPAAH